MKKTVILLSLLILAMVLNAQNKGGNSIIGTILNAENKLPLEYATVTIFIKGDTKPFTGTTTDKTGSFTLTEIPSGTFKLVVENIGFTAFTKNEMVITKKDAIIDLKNILLSMQKNTLQDVTVVAKSKLVENKIDKIVFNAEKDISSQGGVATDVLKKVPQVSVDAEGNVQLAGNSGIRFLINGKPSSAFGSNIADVLQSIPASQIKSIEVITNPGAKYDAQGMGGIINIILKSNNTQGYNGNISLSAGTRNENASVNLNVRKSNFGINAFFSGNKRLRSGASSNNHRVTDDSGVISMLDQSSNNHFDRQGYQAGTGFDWTLNKFNSFTGNITYRYFRFDGSGTTSQVLQPDKAASTPAILSTVNAGNRYLYHSVEGSLNYKRTFKKEDQELEASINIDDGYNDGRSYSEQFLFPAGTLDYGTKAFNPANTSETVASVDYTHPLPKSVKLGVGAKGTFFNIDNTANVTSYQPSSGSYLANDYLSNNLTYNQKVYAGYAEVSFPVGKLFDAKIGSRYERTQINAYYSNAGDVKIPGYNTVVPSIFLSKKIGDAQTIKLSFSKRIQRPDYEDLNPFVNTTDPKNLSTGNPYLKPEIGYRYELGYSSDLGKAGSIMINLFYRINENDIQPYVVYYPFYNVGDSVYTNVSVNTSTNIGREDNAGLNLFGDVHLTGKLSIRGNVFLFHRHIINAVDKGYNSNSYNYRFNMNVTYQFTNSLVAEFFGNFNSPRNEAQGRYPSFTSYTMAVRKQFWQKKGSLALTATNLFAETLTQKTILRGTNFTQNGERIIPFRSIGINFTWKFGKLEFKKGNEENGDNNLNAPTQ
jgi:ferric enterobactin receptor